MWEPATVDKCTQWLVFDFSLSRFLEFTDCMGKGAKGVARSGFPRARFAQNGSIGGAAWPPLARLLARLDARLRRQGAVLAPIRLVARPHDMAVMGEPVQQRDCHFGVPKDARPFAKAQV